MKILTGLWRDSKMNQILLELDTDKKEKISS